MKVKLKSCLLVPAAFLLAACATTATGAPAPSAPSPVIIVVTATPTATPEAVSYVVVQGDNLGRIARAYGVRVEDLVALNSITDPNRIAVGQVLLIPSATPVSGASVAPSDTPTSLPPTATPAPTVVATPSPTEAPATATPAPAGTRGGMAMPDPTATATSTVAARPTETATATKAAAVTRAPTFAPTATFLPTATKTATPTATATATPLPTLTPLAAATASTEATATASAEVAGINLTPADEALATAMQAAMDEYGVQRVVIADAREQGGARVAIGTLFLTQEQEKSDQEMNLPLGAMLAAGYRVAVLAGAADDLDSIAIVIASSEGNAAALVGARTVDIAAFVQGTLAEADFVRRWVVRDF